MNAEVRISLAVAGGFEAGWYVQAQKIRTRAEKHFRFSGLLWRAAGAGERVRGCTVQGACM